MAQHYLSSLFSPKSVAVIGVSDRPETVGHIVFRNLLDNGYKGRLYAISPRHSEIEGQATYAGIDQIPEPVELVVIATPAETVPALIEACGKQGVRAAIVLSAGFSEAGEHGAGLQQALFDTARQYGVRIIGPNCLGLIRTRTGLDATFFRGQVRRGNLALVSQSGALCTAILDWAASQQIGFSSVVSMGASVDVDFGEVLDYLANDPQTESILLYVEGIHKARVFMSSLRAAARNKPVLVVKVGRHAAGSRAVMSHTGALVGSDDVFDAALRRAGVVRVNSITALFSAAKSLASRYRYRGNRLAIITNGGGPGVMAVDRAVDLKLEIAQLSEQTISQLSRILPAAWSHNNPVDVLGDASPEHYRDALTLCMSDPGVDGVLVILTPQAMTQPTAAAEAVLTVASMFNKPLLTCWMGDVQIAAGRQRFSDAQIPTFRTPEAAVEAFATITAFYRNQRLLAQVPGPISRYSPPDLDSARRLIDSVLASGRTLLNEQESKALLQAFEIPVTQIRPAHSADEAVRLADAIGYPVVMKINSPDISHKTDVDGVRLNLPNAAAVREAFEDIQVRAHQHNPEARLDGVNLQTMIIKPHGRELLLGITTDPVFGPVIVFGSGGIAVEALGDRAVALPPLNRFLARELIHSTRIARMLEQFRHLPAVQMELLESLLLRVSEMACELPELRELDINPLLIDEHGAVALDARVLIGAPPDSRDRYHHMAIYPYPSHLVSHWQLHDGTPIILRPIRPEDAENEQAFVRELSEETKYFRFMNTVHELSQEMLVRFTQIDYDREMALIAVTIAKSEDGEKEIEIGVCRYITNPDGQSCEFALVVSDRWQGKGIGRRMMYALMRIARNKGLKTMEGEILSHNKNMLRLAANLGFSIRNNPEDSSIKQVSRNLEQLPGDE